MIKRLLSVLLCLMISMAFMPTVAFGLDTKTSEKKTEKDSSGKEYYSKIVLNPYTFYDVAGGSKKKLDDAMIRKVVKDNLLTPWSYVAMGCFAGAGDCATIDSYRFNEAFFNDSPKNDCFGNVRKVLTGENQNKGKVSRDNLWGTGLLTTDKLSNLPDEMGKQIVKQIDHNGCILSDVMAQGPKSKTTNQPCVLEDLTEMNSKQTVVYSIATSINEKSWNRYKYNSFGIAFYDFQPRAIQAEDLVYKGAADGYDSLEEAKNNGVPGVDYNVKATDNKALAAINESSRPVSQGLSYKNSHDVTVTNSYQTASSYSFGQSLNISHTWGASNMVSPSITETASSTVALQFTFQQMFSNTETNTKSEKHGDEKTFNQSLSLEPQTAVQMTTGKTSTTMSEEYDTPVMISYKVALFSITGDVYADNGVHGGGSYSTAGYKHGFYLNTFGADDAMGISAAENLYTRAITNQQTGRKDDASGGIIHRYYKNNGGSSYDTHNVGTDWHSGLFTDSKEKVGENVNKAAKEIPMMSCGCSYDIQVDSQKNTVGELEPLYLPKEFRLGKGNGEYELTAGDKLNLSKQLEVICLNKNEIPYYGFSQSDGRWVSCDENGNPTDTDCFNITTNGVGEQILTSSNSGTGYVTWKMKDNVKYSGVKDSEIVTSESNLKSPIVRILVKDVAFEGRVNVEGTFNGCVGDENVNLNDQLVARAYDKTEKEVRVPFAWEQKEVDGINVEENGKISMTKAGDYHVRAVVKNTDLSEDDVYSDWYPISVKEARKLTAVRFEQPEEEKETRVMAEPKSMTHYFDLDSYLKAYDQYGDPWKGSLDEVEYVVFSDDRENAHIDKENRHLVVEGEGDFEVHPLLNSEAATDDIRPAPMKLSFSDNLKHNAGTIRMKVGEIHKIEATDYSGKPLEGNLSFRSGNPAVAEVDQTGTIKAINAGEAEITIEDGLGGDETLVVIVSPKQQTIVKKANPLKIKGKIATIKYKKLKKKSQALEVSKVIKFTKKGIGKMSYKLSSVKKDKKSFKKYIKVNGKTGKVTVKKGLKKGTYKVKLKVKAAGNAKYKASTWKAVTFKVRVK